jgi:hypothetical protein
MKQFPPELQQFFSAYNMHDPQLVSDENTEPQGLGDQHPRKLDVWVSYVPHLKRFYACPEGLREIYAASLPELLAKIAEIAPDAEIALHLNARAEVARKK